MNRDKALFIADRIMTRIETDKAVHKDAIADEIQAGDAIDEIVDVIWHDGEKWVHKDGTPFEAPKLEPAPPPPRPTNAELLDLITAGLSVHRIRLEDFKF